MDLEKSHIGPVAWVVHNAYASISCSYKVWLSLLENAQGNIFDILSELDMRSKNLLGFYRIFNQSSVGLSYNHQLIFKFYTTTSNYISELKANLLNFNQTLNVIDIQIQSTIDRLINETYVTCIDAIQDSITKKKNCTTSIPVDQKKIFDAVNDGISQCSHKYIEFYLFNGFTSLGLRVPTNTLTELIACATGPFTNENEPNKCIKSVSFT